jgi:hypothetical protein
VDADFDSTFSNNMRMLSKNFDLDEYSEEGSVQNISMAPNIVNRNSVIMEQPVENEYDSNDSSVSYQEDDSYKTV